MGPDPNPNTASAIGPATMARLEQAPLETRRKPEAIWGQNGWRTVPAAAGPCVAHDGVVGRAGAGRGEFSEDGFPVGEGWHRVLRPYDLNDANAFGVEVRGDSMSPRYENKEIVVCSPNKEWHSGDYCVVKTVAGEYLIKRIKKANADLVLISIAHGYDPIIMPLSDIAGIYRIVWKKER